MRVEIAARIGQIGLLDDRRIDILSPFSTPVLGLGMAGRSFEKMAVSGSSSSTIDGIGRERHATRSCFNEVFIPMNVFTVSEGNLRRLCEDGAAKYLSSTLFSSSSTHQRKRNRSRCFDKTH